MEIEGLDNLIRKLNEIEKETPGLKKKVLKKQAQKVVANAKLLTPVDKGILRGDWHFHYAQKVGEDEALVYNNVHYASHIEWGRRTKNGGFVEGVFMLKKSLNKVESEFEADLRDFMRRLVR